MKKGSSAAHSELVNKILLELGSTKYVRLWKNSTGMAYSASGNAISFGLPGSGDLIGILKNGRFISIECKTGSATQTKNQKNFHKMIETFGGLYILARPGDDILIQIIKAATE